MPRDRIEKAKIYARAGIAEYWIVDVKKRQVIVLREPNADTYEFEQILTGGDRLTPLAFPEMAIDLKHFLV